jgi:hypothetical protein
VRDAGSNNADIEKLDLNKSEHSSAERPRHSDSSFSASVCIVGHGPVPLRAPSARSIPARQLGGAGSPLPTGGNTPLGLPWEFTL